MKWSLLDSNDLVQNIIVYDGSAQYTPAIGLHLAQINNWVEISQHKDTSEPEQL